MKGKVFRIIFSTVCLFSFVVNFSASTSLAFFSYARAENSWISELESMPTPRKGAESVTVGRNIYVIGGQDVNGYSSKVEVYNVDSIEPSPPYASIEGGDSFFTLFN